jgi:glycine/D-amino acid oxidase-like deaminating enzyme
MLTTAEAVVIGSGALGSSIAFHLAKFGMNPVVLVDRFAIASQTSTRAAGLTAVVRGSDVMTRLASSAVDKIRNFTAETGEPIEYVPSGSLKIARTAAHEKQLREEVKRGQNLGVEIDFVSVAEACRLMPFLMPTGIQAITHTPGDLYLEPGQLPRGYARALERLGGVLLPNTAVNGIDFKAGVIERVITSCGDIRTGIVVNAAGAWTRQVAANAGSRLGLIATRHQLLITKPIDGVRANQPITRVIDCNVYVRPADGGLMLGGYESDPLQFEANLPASIDDLPLDLGVLSRLAARVSDQFPIFQSANVKEFRGGLPTMTADGKHIVGAVPNLGGFYVAGGCCVGGLSIAPIIGQLMAEWITSGRQPSLLSSLSPARSAVRVFTEETLHQDCRRQYRYHYWSEQPGLGNGEEDVGTK